MEYELLVDRVFANLPSSSQGKERFEIPKVVGHLQGNKTLISNIHAIAKTLNRPPELVQKYILKELASRGDLTKTALIIASKIPASRINEKIKQFASTFVICLDCGKPDTELQKREGLMYMHCQACGAKHPIRERI